MTHEYLSRMVKTVQNLKKLCIFATPQERKAIMYNFFEAVYSKNGVIKAVEPTLAMWVLLGYVKRGRQVLMPIDVPAIAPEIIQPKIHAA